MRPSRVKRWTIEALICWTAWSGFVYAQAVSRPPAKPHPVTAGEARIAMANEGGIYNWQVLDDRTLYIQGRDRHWYKATLLSACHDLPFAERVGFESNPDGSFDKFSRIRAGEQSCALSSFTQVSAPTPSPKAPRAGRSAPSGPAH